MEQDNAGLLKRLRKPSGKDIDVIIDTDTYNEIDDQFALAFLIKSDERLHLKGIYAAPFYNANSSSPADGMEKSYDEILNILTLMKREDLKGIVKKGSTKYLPLETEAVDSPAAKHLAEIAMSYTEDKPLYIVAIGAITNIASALILRPEIKDRIVLVWLGGHAHHWPDTKEFNMFQDVAAARVVFGCGIALVQLPCMGVVSSFTVSGPELEYWLRGKNELCDYLTEYTTKSAIKDGGMPNWTRVVWDVTAVAWLLDGDYMLDRLEPSPIPQYDHHYGFDPNRHFIRYVYHINRDKLFKTLFDTLAK
ncbi:nucleoside hydrolase [Leadbettera azotonutricia]|uniref:Inosine-uridine preferring nucleoside hydrolase superfamily n=1 Tax=Leadbettera azotonutricia (strain ATCC BAA-888 / DSM 13862 / ZAS-9) TaxID=545695 RepID=F5YDY2_LEAAZ|nr:nucleoside hydrolase [Leadbettera azotonutricia]AEF82403.1 inosine-uridine preferring nucleoside hydrolase superfamily [Leadbettera azotonutricia ZAS-9]